MDVVITYVDITERFKEQYSKYVKKELEENRFRSYGVLDLQIKGIRKYMPYIKNIFVVVSEKEQVESIDLSDAIIIEHKDIIPERYLPCFNSCSIEMFLWKIPGLDEEFIYFNDDIFVIDKIHPSKWFIKGKPVLFPKEHEIKEEENIFKKNCINSSKLAIDITGSDIKDKYFTQAHCARPFLKSSCEKVFNLKVLDIIHSLTRTRHSKNYNASLFNNYDYLSGNCYIMENKYGYYLTYDLDSISYINDKICSIICINDAEWQDYDFNVELRNVLQANIKDKKYKKPEKIEEPIKESVLNDKSLLKRDEKIMKLLQGAKIHEIDTFTYLKDKKTYKDNLEKYKVIFDKDYYNFIKELDKISKNKNIKNKLYNGEIGIISLTSWKNRITTVSKTLYSLLLHCINFHIVLVLSEEEFPNKENELPDELKLLLKNELIEILWVVKNYKAFKKVLFTIDKYKKLPVISADDDCIYLYNYAQKYYDIWKNTNNFVSLYKNETELGITLGGAATLYPPFIFKNYGLLMLDDEIVSITNQDDDLYRVLRKKLNLKNCVKANVNWMLTYYFHDEINPLHDELKTLDRKKLAKILEDKFDNNCKPIIVSMTSYPQRINNVNKSIYHLLNNQTINPDEIHIWLSIEEFPNKENDLPKDLNNTLNKNNNIILHWLEKNTYVHKRHEIFKYFDDAYVFFIDDDVIYNPKLIETVLDVAKKYPKTIITYNKYNPHIYEEKHIVYINNHLGSGPFINKLRWCGQSMIPANVYPKEILSDEYQKIRNNTSPVSDECWFQPWIVYYNIPIYQCSLGWGKNIDPINTKEKGIVSWSHEVINGYERRDIWLNNVLTNIPKLLHKYEVEFNYGQFGNKDWFLHCEKMIPDIIKLYSKRMNKEILNFYNPKTINEKLNWLKIYDATYLKTRCCDKIELRNYCKEKIGKDLCAPIIKVYNSFNEINFEELPDNYVLKTNHGSQTNIIVKDKQINIKDAAEKFNKWLSQDWTWWGLEMPYERIPKKIFAEKYLFDDEQVNSLYDYKFWCFNGEPKFMTINDGLGHGNMDFFNMNYEKIDISRIGFKSMNKDIPKPKTFNLMVEYAKIFSEDFRFVRVDFYEVNKKLYLGELTFYPGAGYLSYNDKNTNLELGNLLKL